MVLCVSYRGLSTLVDVEFSEGLDRVLELSVSLSRVFEVLVNLDGDVANMLEAVCHRLS